MTMETLKTAQNEKISLLLLVKAVQSVIYVLREVYNVLNLLY